MITQKEQIVKKVGLLDENCVSILGSMASQLGGGESEVGKLVPSYL